MKKALIVASLVSLFVPKLYSAVVFSDSFTYPDGPIVSAPGTPWVAHSGTGSMMVSNNMLVVSRSRGEDVNATLAGGPYLLTDSSAALYASFTMNISNDFPTLAGTYFTHFKGTNTGPLTDFGARLFVTTSNTVAKTATPASTYRLSIGNGAAATNIDTMPQIDTDLAAGTPYKIVLKFVPSTGIATVWLNPNQETDGHVDGNDPGTATVSNQFNVFAYAFRQNAGEGTVYVDDLKVGTAFNDVAGANTSPTISSIPNQVIPASTSTAALAITVGDAESAAGTLILTGTSSNTNLVPNSNANITFGGSGANRTVTITPVAGLQGTTTITVNVSDGVNSSFTTFNVGVGSPVISSIGSIIVLSNTAIPAIPFTVGDAESDPLTLTAFSSNPALIPNANVLFGGSGSNRTVTITPLANQVGLSAITVSVTDGFTTNSSKFNVTVRPELGLLFSDNFAYTSFSVPNALYLASGSPWGPPAGSSADALQIQVTNGWAYMSRTNTEDLGAALTNGPYATTDGVVFYTAFQVNFSVLPSPNGNYFVHLKSSASDNINFRARVFASTTNAASGSFRLGVANNSAAQSIQFPLDLSLNAIYTVVTRYNSTTGESVLWVNPISENSTSVAAPDLPSTTAIGGIALREDTFMGDMAIASLKVGTSFSDVFTAPVAPTPEPLQAALVGSSLVLSWTNSAFSLSSASVVDGTYTKISGATSPYTNSISGAQSYYRLVWP
jgi:hypothetical protein